jgi:hypothetical protein
LHLSAVKSRNDTPLNMMICLAVERKGRGGGGGLKAILMENKACVANSGRPNPGPKTTQQPSQRMGWGRLPCYQDSFRKNRKDEDKRPFVCSQE